MTVQVRNKWGVIWRHLPYTDLNYCYNRFIAHSSKVLNDNIVRFLYQYAIKSGAMTTNSMIGN